MILIERVHTLLDLLSSLVGATDSTVKVDFQLFQVGQLGQNSARPSSTYVVYEALAAPLGDYFDNYSSARYVRVSGSGVA